jgi:DNA-binding Lrp family transcriptional regulator
MTVRAYVLVNCEAKKAAEVQKALQGRPGIHVADVVMGPHDVILTVEAGDLHDLGHFVIADIHGVPGVINTLTYPVVEAPPA